MEELAPRCIWDAEIMRVRVPSTLLIAEVAQLAERNLAKVEVAGSDPVFRSNDWCATGGMTHRSCHPIGM